MREDAFTRLKSFFGDISGDRTKLIRILLIILILALALVLRIHEDNKADITVENSSEGSAAEEICVDIGGAVVSPGVYSVARNTRLYEVIDMAGGLLSDADTNSINRAAFVEDGEKIIIPVRPYADAAQVNSSGASSQEDSPESSSDEADAAAVSAEPADNTSYASAGLVNINYASKEELMTLSGIGEAKADKIIEYRSSTRFKKKEDIKSVNGIGDAIYDKIKDFITV